MNYKDKLIAGLLALGWKRDLNTRSAKYFAFFHPDKQTLIFVGDRGALRMGDCASNSHSIGDPSNQTPVYKRILNGGVKPT
jgi:hypothetical protein